jgi:hypothetical protein
MEQTSQPSKVTEILILLVIIAVAVAFGLYWNRNADEDALRVLTAAGYRNIEMTGYRPQGCNNTLYRRGFRAFGPTNVPLTGVVCGGLSEPYTIHID